MAQRPDTDDYRSLFMADVPMMDMRAPLEFAQGSFPSAKNLPLMSDEERAQVGTCYKQSGQAAAITLGHHLVSGELRQSRLLDWSQFARDYPEGYLYCFRGGLRSQTVQQWLRESGIDYPLVRGGYKAMRQFLLKDFEQSVQEANFVLIAGKTGTGKTRVINQLSRAIDLEGLAGHRGSTFGQLLEPQPSQIDFENALATDLMKLLGAGERRVYLEDEGHLIGQRALPRVLGERMSEAPMLVVEQSMEERIDVVIEDYVIDLGERFELAHGPEGPVLHCRKLQDDLFRIRKRLGGERHQRASALLDNAFARQGRDGDCSGHRLWIVELLGGYYDPMYEYQLQKRGGKVLFRGELQEVVARAAELV
jgi:tRNA 2-selenouridine synthase